MIEHKKLYLIEKVFFAWKSLLPAWIISVEWYFSQKDTIVIENEQWIIIWKGIVNYDSDDLKKILGKTLVKEAIHRDNMIIF